MRGFSAILALLLVLMCPFRSASAVEQAAYEVVDSVGEVEIRRYDEGVLAEVSVEASRDEATSKAFRVLFDYIGGNNAGERKISMTAPVVQRPAAREPASLDSADLGQPRRWEIAFFLPADYALEESPAPDDDRVTLTRFAGGRLAALRFSGFWSDDNFAEHTRELREVLAEAGLPIAAGPIFAYYDPPFMPWFLRRNEVLFVLETAGQ